MPHEGLVEQVANRWQLILLAYPPTRKQEATRHPEQLGHSEAASKQLVTERNFYCSWK
jgi:hypothetical protein